MRILVAVMVIAGVGCSATDDQNPQPAAAIRLTAEPLATFPHRADAFTEGLLWADGALYESVGLVGRSDARRVELQTGGIETSTPIPAEQFGEGLAAVDDRLLQLTWKSGVGHVYDRTTMAEVDTFTYAGEGWGLTFDGRRLVMSDGTSRLRFLDPETFAEVGTLEVTDDGVSLERINELEFVQGLIYANIWKRPDIAVIDPATGTVLAWIDTTSLRPAETLDDPDAVANGIAYDPTGDRLFVTGKRWSTLYEIARPKV